LFSSICWSSAACAGAIKAIMTMAQTINEHRDMGFSRLALCG